MRLSFCRQKETARWSYLGDTGQVDCRIDKQLFAIIIPRDGVYRIRIQVAKKPEDITDMSPCEWRWAFLSAKFETLDQAKKFTRKNKEAILSLLASTVRKSLGLENESSESQEA